MALGTLVGFTVTRIATTAATDITPAYYVVARLSSGADVSTLSIYQGLTTAAASKIAELSAGIAAADELGFPIRVEAGAIRCVLSINTAEAFVGVR